MQAGASQPCAVVPGQRPWCEHDMRAARCEWEVLNRLLSIEQVWTARIDAGHECIEYISLDGTTDRTNSFPLGSKVGDIGLGLGWDCAEVTTIYGEVLDPTCNADKDATMMVKENSGIIELEEAQRLAARLQLVMGIKRLRNKCQGMACMVGIIRTSLRGPIDGTGERSQRIDSFKRNMLFHIRVAFLSYCAALYLRRGGDDSDLAPFLKLICWYTQDLQCEDWMCEAILEARMFPRMPSTLTERVRKRDRKLR